MSKQKLLYLVHRIPYPPNKGDKIRSFHFLQALAEEFEIFLGTFIDDPEDQRYVENLKSFCREVCCVDLNPKSSKIKSLRGFVSGEALSLPYYRDSQLQAWVDATIDKQGIERVMIFSSPMAQYVEKYSHLHWVADFVDVDSDKWQQYSSSKTWPASWVYRREAERLLEYERRIAKRADTTLFVLEQEAALFKTLAPESAEKISFVNNGVDTQQFDPDAAYTSPFPAGTKNIVFTGAMDYWANVDAVKWFAEQVFPIVSKRQEYARFYIVGSKPTREVLQLAENDSAVIVTGRVEDIRSYVAHADLVVAPLRIARGIQNKVLEAMAMAKPIVASSAAMEGIPGGADLQVEIANEREEFADRVIKYLEHPIGAVLANRRYVDANFSWDENGQRLRSLLKGESA